MDRVQPKSTKRKLSFLQGSKSLKDNFGSKSIIIGSIIGTIIAMTPFIFNLYQSVPKDKIWDTFLFTYDSKYYESVRVVAWTLANQIVPLILLFLWFFSCRHWWYHAIIVPIAMYVYQAIETLNGDLNFTDANLILYLLPIMCLVIPSIYLIRARMFDRINTQNKTIEELEQEFMIKPTTLMGKLRQYF